MCTSKFICECMFLRPFMFLKMYKKEPDEYNLNLDRFAKLFEGIQWIK